MDHIIRSDRDGQLLLGDVVDCLLAGGILDADIAATPKLWLLWRWHLAGSELQLTLWPVPGDGTERRLQRPKWQHRTSPRSREAARESEPRQGTRKADVLRFVRSRGRHGATREEIAEGLPLPIQSVCGPCRQLLDDELLVETSATRPTRQASVAAVLIAADVLAGDMKEGEA